MCLITEQQTPIILQEDKIVWKTLEFEYPTPSSVEEIEHFMTALLPSSYYFDFKWERGKLYKAEIQPVCLLSGDIFPFDTIVTKAYSKRGSGLEVVEAARNRELYAYGQGFHFFVNKERAYDSCSLMIWQCTIPAGTEVIYDKSGLGICSQIRLDKLIGIPAATMRYLINRLFDWNDPTLEQMDQCMEAFKKHTGYEPSFSSLETMPHHYQWSLALEKEKQNILSVPLFLEQWKNMVDREQL